MIDNLLVTLLSIVGTVAAGLLVFTVKRVLQNQRDLYKAVADTNERMSRCERALAKTNPDVTRILWPK